MSGKKNCMACTRRRIWDDSFPGGFVHVHDCTRLPGCGRAAETEIGADILAKLHRTPLYEGSGEESCLPDEAEGEITRLRAEVERLTDENDELQMRLDAALSTHDLQNAINKRLGDEKRAVIADRHTRDIAVVKAALEMAAGKALRCTHVGCPAYYEIRAIDPDAVLKGMEEGR